MKQRLASFFAAMGQLVIWIPMRILFFYFARLQVGNWEAIKKLPKGPFIMVSNHTSFIDPFLATHLFPFSLRFLPFRYPTAPLHYFTWKRPFMWFLGSYPVYRGTGLDHALAESLQILHQGDRILIFPEGKIWRRGRVRHARRGVAYLAAKSGLPILPCFSEGFYPQKYALGFTWKDLFSRRYHVRVTLGEPFFLSDVYEKPPKTLDDYKRAAQLVMQRVYSLKD